MRTKTRITEQLKPGMVVRSPGALVGTPLHPFREVATVTRPTPWAERCITFTDGTHVLWGNGWEFQVARGKTRRNAAKTRAAIIPGFALADALHLLGGYAYTVAGAR